MPTIERCKVSEELVRQIVNAPLNPGVYVFRDAQGKPLYVGKARNLRQRLLSYIRNTGYNPKVKVLVKQAVNVETIITDTEEEAFLLEYALIKKLKPVYNVVWRDGKSFPYICIKKEQFPRVMIIRRPKDDGSEYFGPFSSKTYLEELMSTLRYLFPIRTCNYNLTPENIKKGKFKKCLEYHIGKCMAPCEGLQSESEYMGMISKIRKVLRGEVDDVIADIRKEMHRLANEFKFEEAHQLKLKIERLEKLREKILLVRGTSATADIFAFKDTTAMAFVQYMQVVNGIVLVSHTLRLRKQLDEEPADLLRLAILQARERFHSNSRCVVVPFNVDVPGVDIIVAGDDNSVWSNLMKLAEKNLQAFIDKYYPEGEEKINPAVEELGRVLKLDKPPLHIECIDISNIGDAEITGSVVVFKNGKPVKREYRHYIIKSIDKRDDYQAVYEIVERRFKRLREEKKEFPDLLLIDGGAGQAGKAYDALRALGINNIPVYGLAKRLEVLYLPHVAADPIYIDRRSAALLLLQRIRNEAHRFANRLREKRYFKKQLTSVLEEIPGIGPRRATALIERFGSIEGISKASDEDLATIIPEKLVPVVKKWLRREV